MSGSVDAYEEAKRRLVEVAAGKGFAERREPARAREQAREIHRCPVNLCHQGTGESLEVPERGQFCRRHWAKLSPPMARQVQVGRSIDDDLKLAAQLSEAIKEARRLDEHWHPWAVVYEKRVEGFERWDHCVARWVRVREHGAFIVQGVTGQRWEADRIANYCPTEVWAGDRSGVLASSDHPNRPRERSPLQWVLGLAFQRWKDEQGRAQWPKGLAPTVVNLWTEDEYEWVEAVRLAGRVNG